LKQLVLIKPGDTYSSLNLTETNKRIMDRLGNFGYAFANVNANPDINRDKKEVAFTILVDPGKRVYVRHMNISGNTKTRDEVIRREFRQYEQSWYDGARIKLSRDRVDRLGYFKEVTIETPEVANSNDQVDVALAVIEKPTGSLTFGAGYSSQEKLTLTGSIQQQNAFGSGNTVGLEVNTSQLNRTIGVSQVNPYFTDDGVSRAYELFLRTSRPPLINAGDYKVQTMGGNIRFGVPFTEIDTVFFGIGLERTKVDTYFNVPGYNNSPQVYLQYTKDFGDGSSATTNTFPFTIAWARDSRDNVLTPSAGRMYRVNFDIAPVGDLRYYRTVFQAQWYKPLFRWMTLALNGEFDYGKGIGGKPYPIFKNFYAGGIGSIRGFDSSSLGPRSAITNDPLGGPTRVIGNVELQFPFPGSGNDRSLRWFLFGDGGNLFAEGEKIRWNQMRYATGIGVSWVSPVGPLKLSYGNPLNVKDGDRTQRFQFQMGTGF
jgi:outer membrane protein insertion porin family